jgi:hypothetical protein
MHGRQRARCSLGNRPVHDTVTSETCGEFDFAARQPNIGQHAMLELLELANAPSPAALGSKCAPETSERWHDPQPLVPQMACPCNCTGG